MNKHTTYISIALLLVLASSCKKFIEVEDPIDQITSDKVFKDNRTAMSALAGVYISMSTNSTVPIISNGAITIYAGLSSDEMFYTGTSATDLEFSTNSIS